MPPIPAHPSVHSPQSLRTCPPVDAPVQPACVSRPVRVPIRGGAVSIASHAHLFGALHVANSAGHPPVSVETRAWGAPEVVPTTETDHAR